MGFIAAAIIGSAVVGGAASYMSSRNARKAQDSQNRSNVQQADMANQMEMERYYQSRGAPMGATYGELTARPFTEDGSNNAAYDENLSMFNPDGTTKESAVLPMYLAGLEGNLADNISGKYDSLTEAYDPEAQLRAMQGYREQLTGAEQGMIDAVNNVYSGNELANTNRYLDSIQNSRMAGLSEVAKARVLQGQNKADARLVGAEGLEQARLRGLGEIQDARLSQSQAEAQAILNEGQRNAARQDFTGRSGIVGNSGNAQANTLAALMDAYASAGMNAADNRLLNAKDASGVYVDNAADMNEVGIQNAIDAAQVGEMTAIDLARVLEQGQTDRFKSYQDNLNNQKNFNQTTGALNALAQNQTAGISNYYAAEDATSNALNRAGMQLGQGRVPEVNVPSFTAPVKTNALEIVNDAVKSGVAGYQLVNAINKKKEGS